MKKTKVKNTARKEVVETVDPEAGPERGEGPGTPAAPESPQEATAKSNPLQELQARVEKLQDSLLRAKADYQNLLRRSAIERADAIRYANAELMKSLLGVIDDFERSLAATSRARKEADNLQPVVDKTSRARQEADNLHAVVDGVRLVHQNLILALRAGGLQAVDALHEPFDPGIHEAMSQQPSADYPPGTVVEEVAKGYRLHDRVLRPTKVIVSKRPDAGPAKREDAADQEEADR